MDITFLIGNGFDVGMDLKSQFQDFFPIYVERSKNKPKEIRMLSERINENFETWSDFEVQMGDYTREFSKDNRKIYSDQFSDFEKDFMKYLKREERKSLGIIRRSKMKKQFKRGLRNFYKSDNLGERSSTKISRIINALNTQSKYIRYNFLVFNYTDTLERCFSLWDIINRTVGKTVHIHGRIDDRPIMGVNDTFQIANKELAKDAEFTHCLVKPTLNSLQGTGRDAKGVRLIAGSDIICIYGMSLGATDRCWWERILQWLNDDEKRQLVIFDHDDNYNEVSQFDWTNKETAIMQKLSGYVPDPKIDIKKLRPRIHIAVNKDIFQLHSKKRRNQRRLHQHKVPAPVS